jgi:LPXTG-motif cell wall-anchored protein
VRLALGVGVLSFIGMLLFASYYDQVGLSLGQIWLLTLGIPGLIGGAIFGVLLRRKRSHATFDPISQG